MNEEYGNPITWKGQESIQPILETLQQNGTVMFHFPDNYHHTLFVHMYSEAPPGQAETVDKETFRKKRSKLIQHSAATTRCTIRLR